MVNLDLIFYNIGAFICACFVLEHGADRFIDHTVIVAKRLGLDQTLIALLTAGAEWEELAVVVAALAQRKPSLALGNIIGSCISNILGAFSLGLLFRPFSTFDQSARVYSLIQLIVTASVVASLATAGPRRMGKIGGSILVVSFGLYVISIAWSIHHGLVRAPEVEQSDSDESSNAGSNSRRNPVVTVEASHVGMRQTSDTESSRNLDGISLTPSTSAAGRGRRLRHHIFQIVISFLALSLSGYVLSHSASSLSSLLGLSETVVGLTILSFATTLPEKFVSLVSGSRGHSGILVAATAGSNIFLLTLCIGVALLGTPNVQLSPGGLRIGEIIFLCVSACTFTALVWLGTKRWIGALMFAGYVTFIVLEFTIWRR